MLLLALLEGVDTKSYTFIQSNISEVVSSIKDNRPSLIKDVALKKLYDVLYSTIENEPPKPENAGLNMAIGMALGGVIKGDIENIKNDSKIQALRDKLRGEIIAALTPQPHTSQQP